MKLGKPAVFIGQVVLLHALVVYHALAGDTVDPPPTVGQSITNTTVVKQAETAPKAKRSALKSKKVRPAPARAKQPKRRALSKTIPSPKPLLPGALNPSSIYEDQGQMLADLSNGWSAETTLDPWLNQKAEYYLRRGKVPLGAVVMMDVRSGDVLVMADQFMRNHPITQGIETEGPPSVALRKLAPAASLFKILSGAALLDSGFDPYRRFPYTYAKRRVQSKHLKKPGAGADSASLGDALAKSNNGFFARISDMRLSRDGLVKAVDRFGFNRVIPFAILTDASTARVPRNRLERARMSAGFGHSQITTLHAAVIAAAVAGDGQLPAPRLVSRLHGPKGRVIDAPARKPIGRAMKQSTARTLRHMMAKTVKHGTARKSFAKWPKRLSRIRIGGKTGTLSSGSPRTTYTWFVGYAPVDNPEVAIAVMVGNGEKWWQRGVDIARDVLASYFTRKAKRTIKSRR